MQHACRTMRCYDGNKELRRGPKDTVFTCLGQFGDWFLVEGIFPPMMGTQLVMRSFPGRPFQRVLLNISARSLRFRVWKFLFYKLSSCFLQEHLLPSHAHGHLGKGVSIKSPFLDRLEATRHSLLKSDRFTLGSPGNDLEFKFSVYRHHQDLQRR